MKRKYMESGKFAEYQAGFRYPNINMGWILPDEVDQYLPKIESYLKRPKMPPYKQFEDPLMVTCSTIERRYVTGRPIDEVYEIIEKSIRIFTKIMDEACKITTPDNIQELYCGNTTIEHYLCECLLIANDDYLSTWTKQVEELLSNDLQDMGKDNRLLRVSFIRMLLAIARKDAPGIIEELCIECYRENMDTLEYSNESELKPIALGESDAFDRYMKKKAQDIFGSERSRAKKKSIVRISDRFSYGLLLQTALALHRGITINFSDSGIPIKDFPIAHRPEIKSLLPQE